MKWYYVKTVGINSISDNCELFGVNIFKYNWQNTGKKANVKDPLYNQDYTFIIWKVKINNVEYEFAAGEFSNSVMGFYLPED